MVPCEYCDREFEEDEHMEQHCDAKHNYPCEYCEFTFYTTQQLDEHEDEEHFIVECDDENCNDMFLTEASMKQHWNDKHYFPCDYCDYYFSSQVELDDHDEEEHLTVTCNYCNRLFRQEEHMEQHKRDKHENVDYFPCNYCSLIFDTALQRSHHYVNYHRISN